MNSDQRSSRNPPPGLGWRCPPPGFQQRPVPFPSNEFQPPLHPTPTSRPTVSTSSPPIRSAVFSRPLYSTAARSSPLKPVTTYQPTPITPPAPISSPENLSLFSEPGNLLGPIRRPLPGELTSAKKPSAATSIQPPSNISPAAPPAHQIINHQPCHIHLQPVYIWRCCCVPCPPPATDVNAVNQNDKKPVVHQGPVHQTPDTNRNTTPEVSILSLFNDSPVERPERPSIDYKESSNARQIPKRKNRRSQRNRQNGEQQIPAGSIRPELPAEAFFAPIQGRAPESRTSAPSTTRDFSPLIRPVPLCSAITRAAPAGLKGRMYGRQE